MDLLSLLHAEGFATGVLRTKNPKGSGEWWLPVIASAKAAGPYVVAIGTVIRCWLKGLVGRQVKFEDGRIKISATDPSDVERVLAAVVKYQKQLLSLHVTTPPPGPKRRDVKKATKKRS